MTGAATAQYRHEWRGAETIVRETLRRLYLLRLASGPRCPVERLGAISGGLTDPHRMLAEEGELATYLKGCTEEERIAMEVEVVYEDLHVGRVDTPEPPPRHGHYKVVRLTSKCDELRRRTGQPWYPRKYFNAVNAGFRKVEVNMRLKGAL